MSSATCSKTRALTPWPNWGASLHLTGMEVGYKLIRRDVLQNIAPVERRSRGYLRNITRCRPFRHFGYSGRRGCITRRHSGGKKAITVSAA